MPSRLLAPLPHYAAAALLVRLADAGGRVALTLLALERTGSAALGGALVAALLVPHVVAAPVVGLWADRAARPQWLTAGAAVVLACGLAVATATVGREPVAVTLAGLVVAGCLGPALTGALSGRLGEIVPAARLPRAFGIDSATYTVAGVLGPATVAASAAIWSATAATLLLAGCALAGAAVVAALPVRAPHPPRVFGVGARPSDDAPRLGDGITAIRRSRVLAVVTAGSTIGDVPSGMLPVAAVLVAQAAGVPGAAGWLVTALAVGAVAGSLACTWRPVPAARAPWVLTAALAASGVPLAVAAVATPGPITAGVLFAVSGVAQGPLISAMFVARQEHSPAAVRGQVFTIGAGLRITAEAGGAALAGLVAAVGAPVVLGLAATFPLGAAAGSAAVLRRPAKVPAESPSLAVASPASQEQR